MPSFCCFIFLRRYVCFLFFHYPCVHVSPLFLYFLLLLLFAPSSSQWWLLFVVAVVAALGLYCRLLLLLWLVLQPLLLWYPLLLQLATSWSRFLLEFICVFVILLSVYIARHCVVSEILSRSPFSKSYLFIRIFSYFSQFVITPLPLQHPVLDFVFCLPVALLFAALAVACCACCLLARAWNGTCYGHVCFCCCCCCCCCCCFPFCLCADAFVAIVVSASLSLCFLLFARAFVSVMGVVVVSVLFLSLFVFVVVAALLVLCLRLSRCLYLFPSLALFSHCWFEFASPDKRNKQKKQVPGDVLVTSGAGTRKCSKWAFWGPF